MSPGLEHDNKGPGKRKPLKWFCKVFFFCEWTKPQPGIYNDIFAPNWHLDQVLTVATLGAEQEKQRTKPRTCSVCNAKSKPCQHDFLPDCQKTNDTSSQLHFIEIKQQKVLTVM